MGYRVWIHSTPFLTYTEENNSAQPCSVVRLSPSLMHLSFIYQVSIPIYFSLCIAADLCRQIVQCVFSQQLLESYFRVFATREQSRISSGDFHLSQSGRYTILEASSLRSRLIKRRSCVIHYN